ncbi:DNA-binding transcriptional LysR family regulator [Streptosporangium becharense]|uniref:DNA-binding transcriptional LysR family regulator n=1 Tax=Streptosporangium becharense TaxID=1816182 RepID=A0A7W9IKA3_9ACTN|nr:LysR substrate-binding domain-containing protein [Streptosporangium becharense]MBB2913264.1 DNA-binding transcriptional LysR family regulator [Streptosporangium becharense]MBB5822247.1 DNA-binding transcriptional LysR family regulator [Streptosporangium becharense]
MTSRPLDLLSGRLKLRHLVLVTTIAEQGSVLRAAEHLHLAQPAVTRGLREVEQILGVELFSRGPRGVTPTLFGEAFVDHARAVQAELRRAGDRIAGLADGETGTVTVGTLLAATNVLLPRAIASLKAERPGITVIVKEGTFDSLVPRLIDGETDLVVGRLNPIEDRPGLRQIPLYNEPVTLVARAGHPAGQARTLPELLDYPWILPLEQTALRHELEQVFHREGLSMPGNRVECTSILTIRSLLLETDMIAALPALVVRTDNRLAELPVPLPSVRRSVGVTLPDARALTPAAKAMLDHLRHQAETLQRGLPAGPEGSDLEGSDLEGHRDRPRARP